MPDRVYEVPEVSCEHCVRAISEEPRRRDASVAPAGRTDCGDARTAPVSGASQSAFGWA